MSGQAKLPADKNGYQLEEVELSKLSFLGFEELIALSACSAAHWRLVEDILASMPDALQPDGVRADELDAYRPFAAELELVPGLPRHMP